LLPWVSKIPRHSPNELRPDRLLRNSNITAPQCHGIQRSVWGHSEFPVVAPIEQARSGLTGGGGTRLASRGCCKVVRPASRISGDEGSTKRERSLVRGAFWSTGAGRVRREILSTPC
jgi:hypothetical protein